MKKMKRIFMVVAMITASLTACGNESPVTASTAAETSAEAVKETTVSATESAEVSFDWETMAADDVTLEHYEISNGTWFYHGVEDEKSIEMDGLKGFTAYTSDAIPETEGYLQYLGLNPDGNHVFEVYDILGGRFAVMTFLSDEKFYLDENKDDCYVKWEY